MKSCLLCPKGQRCRGYILHGLILKLYAAMSERGRIDEILHELTREDMVVMAEMGAKARETCWSKGFVMVVARKVADIAKSTDNEAQMRTAIERMIVQMDSLFTKLPKGISIDFSDLTMEIFNQTTRLLDEEGHDAVVPGNVIGLACTAVARRKGE